MLDQGVVLEVIKHLLDYGSVISGGCVRFSDITLWTLIFIWAISIFTRF